MGCPQLRLPINHVLITLDHDSQAQSVGEKSRLHSSSAVNLPEHSPFRRGLAQPKRPLVLHVVFFHRAQLVPEMQASGDCCANANADQQEPAVCRHPNRRCGHDRRRNYQSSRASDRNRHKDLVEARRPTVASLRRDTRRVFPTTLLPSQTIVTTAFSLVSCPD